MALQKDKVTGCGVVGNYWKVAEMTINPIANVSNIVMYLYVNKAARDAANQPLYVKNIQLSAELFPFTIAAMNAKNPIAIAYEAIKNDADLTGSADV